MKNFSKRDRSLIIVIILLIGLAVIKDINKILRDIITCSIIYIIIYWNSNKNIKASIILTLVIYLLLLLLERNKYSVEGFDDSDGNKTSDDSNNTENDNADDDNTEGNNDINTKKDKLTELYEKLDGLGPDAIKLVDEDLSERNTIKNTENLLSSAKEADENNSISPGRNASDLEPYEAQKETFHLINSVQQLSNTVKQLGPLLKEGKKVLEIYKHFKF